MMQKGPKFRMNIWFRIFCHIFAKLFAMADDYKKGDAGQLEKINSSIDSYRIN